GPVAKVRIERGRNRGRCDELGGGGDQEDAQRIAQRNPELALMKYEREVVEPGPAALPADQVPRVERDPARVEQREEADQPKHEEERGDEKVRRELHVPPTEALLEPEAAKCEVLDKDGRGCHKRLLGRNENWTCTRHRLVCS